MCDWLSYGEWCDVKLLCGGQAFNAHRAVLASVSTFLREVLLSCQTDETPTFIVLPDFDLEAMSSVLYYIYNGEVVVQKQKMDKFLDIIKAMQIFIDYQFMTQSSEIIRNTNLDSNVLNFTSNVSRLNIFTLKLGDCGDQIYFNIKKGAMIKNTRQCSLNKSDRQDKQAQSQNWTEHCKASLGNLKSPYGDRQRNSFLRDLFIETYPPNGNVNGQMAGVLAISNEHYRAPASVLLTNANGEDLSADDTVLETFKNPSGIPILPFLSHPTKMQYLHKYNKNYHETYTNACPSQSHPNVCSNDVLKMKSFYEMCETKSYTYGWENNGSAHKRVSLLPVTFKGQLLSETHSSYLDLSTDPSSEVPTSSLNFHSNLAMNKSLYGNAPTRNEKQKCTSGTANSSKAMICNHVLNSPWTSRVPNNFKPFRRKIQDLENTFRQIQKVDNEGVISDTNNNIHKSTSEQNILITDGAQSPLLYPENIKSNYKCTVCGQVYTNNESLSVHMRRHSTTSRYSCSECGKMFSQLRNFKYHMSIHRGTREFAATCTVCGKYFNDRGYLSSHMKIHRNRKEYKCSICPKSFNQRVAYNMHMRIHTGVKPHVCEECGKAFSRKMLLKQHQRTHSGERPYACPHCDKRFADRSNMTLHLRLHTGIKPFSCSLCPKSFTKKHHLKSHLNFHTGSKPYSCPLCKLAFTQSSNMRTHMKKCNVGEPTLTLPPPN